MVVIGVLNVGVPVWGLRGGSLDRQFSFQTFIDLLLLFPHCVYLLCGCVIEPCLILFVMLIFEVIQVSRIGVWIVIFRDSQDCRNVLHQGFSF